MTPRRPSVAAIGFGPLAIAACASALLIWSLAATWLGVLLGGGLLVAMAIVSYLERRSIRTLMMAAENKAACALPLQRMEPYVLSLHAVADASMARWAKHIEIARLQIEHAGTELTCDFSALLAQLQALQDQGQKVPGEDVVKIVDESRQVLMQMLARLEQAVDGQTIRSVPSRQLIDEAGQTIQHTLARLEAVIRNLSAVSERMAVDRQRAYEHVEAVMVHLQFQDRVSQILGAICVGVEALLARLRTEEKHLAEGLVPEPFDVAAWVAEIERTYTTLEQHGHDRSQEKRGAPDIGITYF